jgi:plasmid stabilization system protein ParE
MSLLYSEEALEDLIRLREFIAAKNPSAANRIAAELLKGIENLKTFPSLGVEVRRATDPKSLRDLVLSHYIVRYLIAGSTIYILRIWHHKEDRFPAE